MVTQIVGGIVPEFVLGVVARVVYRFDHDVVYRMVGQVVRHID